MTLSDLKHLIKYTRWANSQVIEEMISHVDVPAKAVTWMAHILAAEHLWLDRMTNDPRNHLVWPDWKLYECLEQQQELERRWLKFFESMVDADLNRAVSYTNSQGKNYTNSVSEILTHLALHAPHHRGQINAELRAMGYDPPYIDYIEAVRTKQI